MSAPGSAVSSGEWVAHTTWPPAFTNWSMWPRSSRQEAKESAASGSSMTYSPGTTNFSRKAARNPSPWLRVSGSRLSRSSASRAVSARRKNPLRADRL